MTAVFMILLAMHVVHSLLANRKDGPGPQLTHGRPNPFMLLSQTPMFVIACFLAFDAGILSRGLLSPVYFGLGLLAGLLIFCASVLVIHVSVLGAFEVFTHGIRMIRFTLDCPAVLSRFITVAFAEELIYRGVAQPILIAWTGSPWAGILIVAVLFSIVHHHFFRNSWRVSGEFLAFGVALGWLYWATGSLLFVMVIHAVRDIAIAYLEFEEKMEELGDWEAAADAIDTAYRPTRAMRVQGGAA